MGQFTNWIKSVVVNSLDRRPPSHQDSSASRLSISNQNTLTPANHRPLTSLHLHHPGEQEKRRGRERAEKEGWTSGWPCTAAFFHLHLLQPRETEREREKEMDLSPPDHHAAAASTCPGGLSPTSVCRTPVALPSIYLLHTVFLMSSFWRSSLAGPGNIRPDVWSIQCV